MDFVVTEVYEKNDYSGLIYASQFRKSGGKVARGIRKMLYPIGGIFFLWSGLFGVYNSIAHYDEIFPNGNDLGIAGILTTIVIPCGLLIFLGLCLLWGMRKSPLLSWLSWRSYKNKGMQLTYHLTDAAFIEKTDVSESRFDYSVIEAVLEDTKRYFLFVTPSMAHILKKASFISGSPEEFRHFIAEKTGKSVQTIK